MTASTVSFKLPPVIGVVAQPDPLESLYSPQLNKLSIITDKQPERDSVVTSEFNDIALEDISFSPVAPNERPFPVLDSSSSISHENGVEGKEKPMASNDDVDVSNTPVKTAPQYPAIPTYMGTARSHNRSASTVTIRSNHSRRESMLVNHLESNPNRGSIHGHMKLQEEFHRLQEHQKANMAISESSINWDFWGAVISDYRSFATDRPEELAQAIQKGIPAALRGMMWQHMAASKDLELEATYLILLKETSTYEKSITRDLGRTFPHHNYFTDGQGIGQENLFNVLKAYSLYDPEVGYCQGLPFLVAILLLNMPDEEAFSLLVRLMTVYDLQGHFVPEMPRLQMRLFQFDRLLEELLPVIHLHFLRQGIKSSMYCSQWFLTIFGYRFPLEIVFRIYDTILANGIEAIFMFGINLLKKNEDALLSLKFDEILGFLNTKLLDCYLVTNPSSKEEPSGQTYRLDEFVEDSVSLKITPFMLDSYRHEYEEAVREATKQASLMDELRSSNRTLSNQVKKLEDNLAGLNVEHVEILNELVKQRLRNEEVEQELVRYKLLYAEAMHQKEGANSSNRISLAQMMHSLRRSS